ncbi:serine hydrolase [Streptomyces lushanensis]|uniref:serine hydrolase n=1 Tax=Streptomyces lushanensis TaxID=1434255 RepID=UPI00083271F6|nr:serine hydrolase [Streptomyces lushanensis]
MDLSVAVYDMADGREAAYGEDRTYACASVVKLAILAALLLRARDAGRWLTAGERRLAAAMIERSDNEAATVLRGEAGGMAGLDAAYARLGMDRTSAAPAWGLTRTTARDQLTLLKAVFGTGGPGPGSRAVADGRTDPVLDARSRRFITGLMERVVPGQDWGVSAAGGDWALKNGWLPRTASGLWVVHSVGRADGRLIAVLSDGHTSLAAGVARVETAAVSAVRRMRRGV